MWCQAVSEVPHPGLLRELTSLATCPMAPCQGRWGITTEPLGSGCCLRRSSLYSFRWNQRGFHKPPRPGPLLWLRAGQDPEHIQGLREKRLHLRYPLESGKHLDILGRKGCGRPHSLFLDFRGVIFPLAGVPQLQANGRESQDPQRSSSSGNGGRIPYQTPTEPGIFPVQLHW